MNLIEKIEISDEDRFKRLLKLRDLFLYFCTQHQNYEMLKQHRRGLEETIKIDESFNREVHPGYSMTDQQRDLLKATTQTALIQFFECFYYVYSSPNAAMARFLGDYLHGPSDSLADMIDKMSKAMALLKKKPQIYGMERTVDSHKIFQHILKPEGTFGRWLYHIKIAHKKIMPIGQSVKESGQEIHIERLAVIYHLLAQFYQQTQTFMIKFVGFLMPTLLPKLFEDIFKSIWQELIESRTYDNGVKEQQEIEEKLTNDFAQLTDQIDQIFRNLQGTVEQIVSIHKEFEKEFPSLKELAQTMNEYYAERDLESYAARIRYGVLYYIDHVKAVAGSLVITETPGAHQPHEITTESMGIANPLENTAATEQEAARISASMKGLSQPAEDPKEATLQIN